MEKLEYLFKQASEVLWGNWMLALFLSVGIYYTIITRGIQFRCLPYWIRRFRNRKKIGKQQHSESALSSVQALFTAIASCVGSGNIVGVSTAILAGGPGALFWMWVAAFLGMATKYAEIVLGIRYRTKDSQGVYNGGPMYYIAAAMKKSWLGGLAAILLFTQNAGATLIQSNTIASVVKESFGIPKLAAGIFVAVLMLFIISGGLKRLAVTASTIVPFMAGFYVLGGLLVMIWHWDQLIPMLHQILEGAFSMKAGTGAAAGFSMRYAMRYGIARGLYSNEAGEGSAAVIHSAACVDHPSRQGLYGIIEVFVDTMIICSTTGFVLLVSGIDLSEVNAATAASSAFATVFPALKYVVSISLILFAGTSIMSQWYFGHVSLVYLKSSKGTQIYRFLFPMLILYGSVSTIDLVWSIQDCILALLVIPNILALFLLSPEVRKLTRGFFKTCDSGYQVMNK